MARLISRYVISAEKDRLNAATRALRMHNRARRQAQDADNPLNYYDNRAQ